MKLNILSLAATLVLLPLTFLQASFHGLGVEQATEIATLCLHGSLYELKRYIKSQENTEVDFRSVLSQALLESAVHGKTLWSCSF